METIRKFSLGATLMNMIVAFVQRISRWVRNTLQMSFIPKGEPGTGGKKKSGKQKKKGNNKPETEPSESITVEWKRIAKDGAETSFARTGGGREDVRPPDFDRYVVFGLGAADEAESDPDSVPCKLAKITLEVQTDCLDGHDTLVIDLIPEYKESLTAGFVSANKLGEYTYFTVASPEAGAGFITYIPEITSPGAIRVQHQQLATVANLGVQFFVRAL